MSAPPPQPLELLLTRHAERDLLSIPSEFRQRIKADLLRLTQGRIAWTQVKKLQSFSPSVWQLTSGRFRVFYRRTGEQVLILRVVPKPEQTQALRAFR